jgi:hypothetical protein
MPLRRLGGRFSVRLAHRPFPKKPLPLFVTGIFEDVADPAEEVIEYTAFLPTATKAAAATAVTKLTGIAEQPFSCGLELLEDASWIVENAGNIWINARLAPTALDHDRDAEAGTLLWVADATGVTRVLLPDQESRINLQLQSFG